MNEDAIITMEILKTLDNDEVSCEVVEFFNKLDQKQVCFWLKEHGHYAIKILRLREKPLYDSAPKNEKELDERMVSTTGPIIRFLMDSGESLNQHDITLLADHRIPPVIGRHTIFDYVDDPRDCAIQYYQFRNRPPLVRRSSSSIISSSGGNNGGGALPEHLDSAILDLIIKGDLEEKEEEERSKIIKNLKDICGQALFDGYIPFCSILSGKYQFAVAEDCSLFSNLVLQYCLRNLKDFLNSPFASIEDPMLGNAASYPASADFIKKHFREPPEYGFSFFLWWAFIALYDASMLKRMFEHDLWHQPLGGTKDHTNKLFKELQEARNKLLELKELEKQEDKTSNKSFFIDVLTRIIYILDAFEIARNINNDSFVLDEMAEKSFCTIFPLFTKCPTTRNIFTKMREKPKWKHDDFSPDLITTYCAVLLFNQQGMLNDVDDCDCKCSFIKSRFTKRRERCRCFIKKNIVDEENKTNDDEDKQEDEDLEEEEDDEDLEVDDDDDDDDDEEYIDDDDDEP